ncbi:hypothetical protein BDB00DRAFT_801142 [Zychaea mexicana]|uniref:uncharacterized protein n=1 Tax=Zychaea mexicana TaxID=64656 RepID=UPI0022FE92F2|nr:uncharacterized protein BDB00DRAFT_801142 [Zychaea mexicana]KAI9498101.1 hypothetical protein BDB00DRAFT_801142 [Zychaea mexicana]
MDTTDAQKELETFRRQWRQEVENRKHQQQQQRLQLQQKQDPVAMAPPEQPIQQDPPPLPEEMQSLSVENDQQQLNEPQSAMDHYIVAVDNERQGKLGQALASYRRAFKMDPDVDRHYKRHYQKHGVEPSLTSSAAPATATKEKGEAQEFRHIVPVGNEYIAPSATGKDPLEDLIREFTSEPVPYLAAVDYKPVHVARIPSELLLHVLRHLILRSVSSVAQFALVCKNFFLLTRAPSLWRFASEHAFKSPYMTLETSRVFQADYVEKVYHGHWLRMFIERPRIRYDGVYISICHYVRMGNNDESYNQPVHLVTYYRYLRFFPDGTILKYLSTDEPARVVRLLTPGFNQRQVFRGHFEQNEGRIYIEMKDRLRPREDFRMVLDIKSTHRGRHNKLTWTEYASVTEGREDEDDTYYDLKKMKPYFFSPVKSYAVDHPLEPPLLEGPLSRRSVPLDQLDQEQ